MRKLLALMIALSAIATAPFASPTEYICESNDPSGNFFISRQGTFGYYSTDLGNDQHGFHYLTCDVDHCAFQMEFGGGTLVSTTHMTFMDNLSRVYITSSLFDTRNGTIDRINAHTVAVDCVVIQ